MPPQRTGKKEKPKDAKGTLRRVLRYIMDYRLFLAGVVLLALASNVLSLLGPSLAGQAIGAAAAGPGQVDMGVVWYYAKRMLVCYLASSVLAFLVNAAMMRLGKLVGRRLRDDVFDKLMALPVRYFDRNAAGDIISRVSYDIDVVSTCISADIVSILTSLVTVTGSFIMMVVICPPLVLVTLVTIPLAVLYTRYMSRRTRPLYARRSAMYGEMNGFAEEQFTGLKTILAYAHEDHVSGRFADINAETADAFCEAEQTACQVGPSVNFINNLGLALVGMLGSLLYLRGSIGLEHISSFVLYSRKFSGPISEIANITSEIYSALAAAERVFRLLDEAEEKADAPDARVLEHVKGQVELQHVTFGYDEDRTILEDFSLLARPGQLVAIVGPTGAGKTTIINLLMRFYDVQAGRCLVDDQDMYRLTRSSLRRAYAMVLQDTWLFKGTIAENVAYGRPDATREEIVRACDEAYCDHFIRTLPKGYDTVIGEDNITISGGQKQLLTIARALLADRKLLILDEATSNVDTRTEVLIQKAMDKLMRGRTSFVIAHRLSTIKDADLILVMKDGDIVEQGSHEALLARGGFYAELYNSQFEDAAG